LVQRDEMSLARCGLFGSGTKGSNPLSSSEESRANLISSKQGPGDRDPLEIADLDRFLVRFDDPASDLYAGRSWLLRVSSTA
jgi:hypothetical protein